jgi:hypothetical protein
MNRPRFLSIDDSMLRRLRVLTVFVGAIWLTFGIIRLVLLTALGGLALALLGLVVGAGFLAFAVLAHLELRARAM